jgi:uncharacterized protein with PIN domain
MAMMNVGLDFKLHCERCLEKLKLVKADIHSVEIKIVYICENCGATYYRIYNYAGQFEL